MYSLIISEKQRAYILKALMSFHEYSLDVRDEVLEPLLQAFDTMPNNHGDGSIADLTLIERQHTGK